MLASPKVLSTRLAAIVSPETVQRSVAVAVVVVVEALLIALFVLGWVSAEPAADAPLAAPAPAALLEGTHGMALDQQFG